LAVSVFVCIGDVDLCGEEEGDLMELSVLTLYVCFYCSYVIEVGLCLCRIPRKENSCLSHMLVIWCRQPMAKHCLCQQTSQLFATPFLTHSIYLTHSTLSNGTC